MAIVGAWLGLTIFFACASSGFCSKYLFVKPHDASDACPDDEGSPSCQHQAGGNMDADVMRLSMLQLRHSGAKPFSQAFGGAAATSAGLVAQNSASYKSQDACSKLGIFTIDGYYWPTQPGDINDKRTFCDVKGADPPNYYCLLKERDDFDIAPITVHGLTWDLVQHGMWNSTIAAAWKQAVKQALSDPCIKAMLGNAGFFTYFQSHVELLMEELVDETRHSLFRLQPKPFIAGVPALAPLMGDEVDGLPLNSWGLLSKPNEMAIVLTDNSVDISGTDLPRLLAAAGVENTSSPVETLKQLYREMPGTFVPDNNYEASLNVKLILQLAMIPNSTWDDRVRFVNAKAPHFRVVGLQDIPYIGWPIVEGGTLYNAYLGASGLEAAVKEARLGLEKQNKSVKAILVECTELPPFANGLRIATKLPVWDVHTLGVCLMAVATTYNSSLPNSIAVFSNAAFRACLMEWFTPEKFTNKFGLQKNGRFSQYETSNYTQEEIDNLICTGGRPSGKPPLGRRIEDYDTGVGGPMFTAACLESPTCGGDGTPMCSGACPSGGQCGEPSMTCGTHGTTCGGGPAIFGHRR